MSKQFIGTNNPYIQDYIQDIRGHFGITPLTTLRYVAIYVATL